MRQLRLFPQPLVALALLAGLWMTWPIAATAAAKGSSNPKEEKKEEAAEKEKKDKEKEKKKKKETPPPTTVKQVVNYLEQNRLEAKHLSVAETLLVAQIKKEPNDPKWQFYLANIYVRQARQKFAVDCDGDERLDKAIATYQKTIACASRNRLFKSFAEDHLERLAQKHFNRGVRYYKKTGYARALDNFDIYQQLHPKDETTQLYQAIAAQQEEKFDDALGYYEAYLQQKDDLSTTYAALGALIFKHKKDSAKALDVFEKGVKQLPYNDELLMEFHKFLAKSKQLKPYQEKLEKRLDEDPEAAYLHYQSAALQQFLAKQAKKDKEKEEEQALGEEKKDGKKGEKGDKKEQQAKDKQDEKPKEGGEADADSAAAPEAPPQEPEGAPAEEASPPTAADIFKQWKTETFQTEEEKTLDTVRKAYERAADLALWEFAPSFQMGMSYYNKVARMIDVVQDMPQPAFEQMVEPFYADLLKLLEEATYYLKKAQRLNPASSIAKKHYKKAKAYTKYVYDQQDSVAAAFVARERMAREIAENQQQMLANNPQPQAAPPLAPATLNPAAPGAPPLLAQPGTPPPTSLQVESPNLA